MGTKLPDPENEKAPTIRPGKWYTARDSNPEPADSDDAAVAPVYSLAAAALAKVNGATTRRFVLPDTLPLAGWSRGEARA